MITLDRREAFRLHVALCIARRALNVDGLAADGFEANRVAEARAALEVEMAEIEEKIIAAAMQSRPWR